MTAPDTSTVRIRPPKAKEPRHPTRRKATDAEAEVLKHYPPANRRELLRRWRAKELFVNDRGLLAEVDPKVREVARRTVAAALERYQARKKRRHDAAVARAKNRRRR